MEGHYIKCGHIAKATKLKFHQSKSATVGCAYRLQPSIYQRSTDIFRYLVDDWAGKV